MQKTLPHALSRAAASGAVEVGPGRLSNVLKTYAVTQDKVGTARTRMDEDIRCVRDEAHELPNVRLGASS